MTRNPEIEICGRKIGLDHEPLVIAEIGINHEGNLDTAFEMVDAAATAGVEIVKHQTHIVADEMTDEARSVIHGNAEVSIYDIMERCALSETEEKELRDYVHSLNMIFISTPFSRAAVDRLERLEVPAYKIGSGECNNYPLVAYIASKGKPVILSTGMNDIESISRSVAILREQEIPYALLHCTNVYPTPPELVRLGALEEMATEFPDAVLGLSDHTLSNYPCLGAVAMGASILERHFTDRMDREGPDIEVSMDPEQARILIEGSRILAKARGGSKHSVEEETPTIRFAYASVVAIEDISAGDELSLKNIWTKRPGTGEILATEFDEVLGKHAIRDIRSGDMLSRTDFK